MSKIHPSAKLAAVRSELARQIRQHTAELNRLLQDADIAKLPVTMRVELRCGKPDVLHAKIGEVTNVRR